VQSLADLQLLLPVVVHWNSPFSARSPDYPHCILEEGGEDEGESLESESPAYFIRAVMGLLGMVTCADGGPNLSVDYAEFAALATRSRAHADASPKGSEVHDPAMRMWEARLGELSDVADKRAEQIVASANPDPRALAAIIWHYLADSYLDRVDLNNLPAPIRDGPGEDAAVLLAARILQGAAL
jgi:hypothetical protein